MAMEDRQKNNRRYFSAKSTKVNAVNRTLEANFLRKRHVSVAASPHSVMTETEFTSWGLPSQSASRYKRPDLKK